jgi:uncharacterized membrane protein
MKNHRFILVALLLVTGSLPAFADAIFAPTGVLDMIPTSMSDDASVVVGTGTFGIPNLYYTEADGVVVIGDGCFSGLPSISGDGSTVLGCHTDNDGNENAARWLGGTDWLDLGSEAGAVPCDDLLSGAWGVNADGSLGVGLLWRVTECQANAGTWDLVNGRSAMVLPQLVEDRSTRANAVNADGSVIVGWQDLKTGQRVAAKWVNGVAELILTRNGGYNGEAHAVSADGNTIVGGGYKFGNDAWIWQEGIGVQPIGLSGHGRLIALDVSDSGRVAVGFSQDSQAFVWQQGKGPQNLARFLRSRGAVIPDGWNLSVASLLSADGNTIYGWGINPDTRVEMFKVVLNAN